jgi:hypothetical protein
MAVLSIPQMKAYAASAGFQGNDAAIAAAIGEAESSGRTDVVNYLGCVGIWQIYQKAHAAAHPNWTTEWLKNPANNAQAAYVVYREQGWKAWTTYTSGAYKKYLGKANGAAADIGGPLNPVNVGRGIGEGASNLAGISDAVTKLSNPKVWVRVLYILVGIACVGIALVKMSAESQTLKTAVKVAGVVK